MMDGDKMAEFVLKEMGGEMRAERVDAFHKLCRAIVKYLQQDAEVTGSAGSNPLTGGKVI